MPGFQIRIDLMRIRIRIWIQHFSNCGSGFRIQITDPDPGFDDLKFKKFIAGNLISFSWSKIAIYLFLGLHKGRPSYRRSLQPSKENIQYLKTWKFWTFFNFCGSFLPSWIRIRIRNLNADPDPDPATQINADPCGSGSKTLLQSNARYTVRKFYWLIRTSPYESTLKKCWHSYLRWPQ